MLEYSGGADVSARAADNNEIPKEGAIYTLTYPDGTSVSENADAQPLGYDDVTEALEMENWELYLMRTIDQTISRESRNA